MIYFIQQGKDGPIKIGYTENAIEKRLGNLQNASPRQLVVLGTLQGDKIEEHLIHKKFHMCQIRGEWFHPHEFLLDFIEENCSEYKRPALRAELSFDVFADGTSLDEGLRSIEKKYIKKALWECENKVSDAAKSLNLSVRQLYYKIKKYNISVTNPLDKDAN